MSCGMAANIDRDWHSGDMRREHFYINAESGIISSEAGGAEAHFIYLAEQFLFEGAVAFIGIRFIYRAESCFFLQA